MREEAAERRGIRSVIADSLPLPFLCAADDELINRADKKRLLRVKKDELIRLSKVCGLLDDDVSEVTETKDVLVDALISQVRTMLKQSLSHGIHKRTGLTLDRMRFLVIATVA
jgi:hypothetical protein